MNATQAGGPAGPPAGSPPERLAVSFKAAMSAVRRLRGRETHRPGALSNAQYAVLFHLADGRARSARELCDAEALSPATVTQMLESLESAGLVARVRSSADRRIVLTTLSDRGRELLQERRARVEPRWREALKPFSSEELENAAAVLDALTRYFDELSAE